MERRAGRVPRQGCCRRVLEHLAAFWSSRGQWDSHDIFDVIVCLCQLGQNIRNGSWAALAQERYVRRLSASRSLTSTSSSSIHPQLHSTPSPKFRIAQRLDTARLPV